MNKEDYIHFVNSIDHEDDIEFLKEMLEVRLNFINDNKVYPSGTTTHSMTSYNSNNRIKIIMILNKATGLNITNIISILNGIDDKKPYYLRNVNEYYIGRLKELGCNLLVCY